jgi:hypothetical protein
VYSPQYDLWIVPFFVLLPIRRKLVANFYAASSAVFVLTASDDHVLHRPASGYVLGAAVVCRLIVFLLVARDVLRTQMAGRGAATIDLPDDEIAKTELRSDTHMSDLRVSGDR